MNPIEQPPFDCAVHLNSSGIELDSVKLEVLHELRLKLDDVHLALEYKDWLTDGTLKRFLIARQFNVKASFDLLVSALEWRKTRVPVNGIESLPGWEEKMSKESETGKIYIPGFDKWNRPVVVFDNTVQNTTSVDDQLTFLAWNLEYACKLMSSDVDKYTVFMHLNNFSFFNCPPFKSTTETIHMLCNCYPERLGHCIAFAAPTVFKIVFDSVRYLIDQRTANKVIIIVGDYSDGSDNDKLLRSLIGDDWKALTGVGQRTLPKCSPGYDHSQYWPFAMQRLKEAMDKDDCDIMKDVPSVRVEAINIENTSSDSATKPYENQNNWQL